MADEQEAYLSARDAAKYLGVHRSRIYQLIEAGLGRQIGGYWLFTQAELDAYKAQPKSKGGRPKSNAPATIRRAGAVRLTA